MFSGTDAMLEIQNGSDFVNAQNWTSGIDLANSIQPKKYCSEKKSPAVWTLTLFAFFGKHSEITLATSPALFPRTASKLHQYLARTEGYLSLTAA
jgi:hypothetical protein